MTVEQRLGNIEQSIATLTVRQQELAVSNQEQYQRILAGFDRQSEYGVETWVFRTQGWLH